MIFSAEWTYLLTTRKVGGEDSAFSYVRIKYGSNATDTVTGTIIYPDDFSFSEAGVASMPFGARRPVTQINAADWAALEEAGCVFFPSAGYLAVAGAGGGLEVADTYFGRNVYCWSSTANNASAAYYINFMTTSFIFYSASTQARNEYISVRLAQDLK